jgi:hypothetical protein
MALPYWEVDVPIHHTTDKDRPRGLHIFTGKASSHSDAVRIAHEVYDQALAAIQAGIEIPGKRPDGWAARGLRPGWELDWTAAKVGLWGDPTT